MAVLPAPFSPGLDGQEYIIVRNFIIQTASSTRLVLLQIQPNVVVVSSKMDDNMQRTLHSYGIWGESNSSLSRVWLFHELMSLAANPENSTGGGTVATIEVLPSSDFHKQISLIYGR